MSLHWNAEFTKRLRTHNDAAWGTITLNSPPPIGAYGTFDGNGEFHQYGVIDLKPDSVAVPAGNFESADSGVKTTENRASVSGSYTDPETGLTVTAGLEWAWDFTKSNTFLLQLPQVYSTKFDNPVVTMQSAEAQLVEAANQVGWTNRDGTVKEGWCMIVEVIQIVAGFVTGAQSSNSSFKINGAVDAMSNLMAGDINAAYSNATSSDQNNMFTYLWPIDPLVNGNGGGSTISSEKVLGTVAVIAASFDHKDVVYPYKG